MPNFRLPAAAIAYALLASNAIADDSKQVKPIKDQVDSLQKEVDRLSAKLKDLRVQKDNVEAALSAKNKWLQEEVEKLRSLLRPAAFQVKLFERINEPVNLTANLIGEISGGDGAPKGEYTLTIKQLDGKKFKGSQMLIVGGKTIQRDIEGTFDADKLSYRSVDPVEKFTVIGRIKDDTIEIEYVDSNGPKAKGVLKLAK